MAVAVTDVTDATDGQRERRGERSWPGATEQAIWGGRRSWMAARGCASEEAACGNAKQAAAQAAAAWASSTKIS